MRKVLAILFLFVGLFAYGQNDLPKRPNPPRLVNDLTNNTLSKSEVRRLEQKLLAYEDTTSTQVAILIVNSLNGYEVADYAVRIFNDWKIGGKQGNNGVLVTVGINERRMNITTGYGMEGVIPDATAFTIIDEYMKPRFRQNNFYRGLDEATDVIFKLASGEFKADEVAKRRNADDDGGSGFPFFILIFIFFFVIPAIGGRKRRRGIGTRNIPWWAWFMMGSGSSGRNENWDNFRGGGGGFGGGSGFGGGGGFGGFGGGMSGGGGASGSW